MPGSYNIDFTSDGGAGHSRRLHRLWVTVARGIHPFPSRTRKLSPSAPMVLHARVCGSVGSCPVYHMARPKGRAFVFLAVNSLAHHYKVGYYFPMRSDMSKVI